MIGIFDSGLGGLTITRELIKKLPEYNYIYLGDNARAPYGNKSAGLILNYTIEAVDFLFKQGCELIILACNTASSEALRKIQQEWLPKNYPTKRVLGVIIPVAEEVAETVINYKQKIGIIGTKATISTGAYDREIMKLNPDLKLASLSTPLLVPLIEEGWINRRETKMILRQYLRRLKKEKVKYLVLGCTHYPFLMKQVQEIMGKACKIFNSPQIITDKLQDYLNRHPELELKLKKNGQIRFCTTDEIENFKKLGEKFLGKEMKEVSKVEL